MMWTFSSAKQLWMTCSLYWCKHLNSEILQNTKYRNEAEVLALPTWLMSHLTTGCVTHILFYYTVWIANQDSCLNCLIVIQKPVQCK